MKIYEDDYDSLVFESDTGKRWLIKSRRLPALCIKCNSEPANIYVGDMYRYVCECGETGPIDQFPILAMEAWDLQQWNNRRLGTGK